METNNNLTPEERRMEMIGKSIEKQLENFVLRKEDFDSASAVPSYNDSWEIRADFAHEKEFGYGKAYIFYGKGNTSITKPIVLVEGFDPFNTTNYVEIYNRMQTYGIWGKLIDKGYDIIILDFNNGSDYIEKNAYVLVALIGKIIAKRTTNEKICIVGASMGGLVTRYALTFMEKNNIDHDTKLMISFDSPQSGANIPLSIQYFLTYFARSDRFPESLRKQVSEILESPASKQMLVYYYNWSGGDGDKATCHELRSKMLKSLSSNGDYPTKNIRKVAIANGSGKGEVFCKPYSIALDLEIFYGSTKVAWAYCHTTPTFTTNTQEMFRAWYCGSVEWYKFMHSMHDYDGCPGGSGDIMQRLNDGLSSFNIKSITNPLAFVPTVSALDIRTNDKITPIAPVVNVEELEKYGNVNTPFDKYIYCEKNTEHFTFNDKIFDFIKTELGL